MNWSLNLITIGVFNGLMLSVLFLRKRDHNRYLGLFLLAHSVILVKYLGNALEMYASFHVLIASGEILEWILGPFLYLYVSHYTRRTISGLFLHFLPVLLYVLILVPLHIYMMKHPEFTLFELHIQRQDFNFLIIPKILQGVFYIVLIIPKIGKNRWILLITGVFALEIVVMTLFYFQFLFTTKDLFSDVLVSGVMALSANFIAVAGLLKSEVFNEPAQPALAYVPLVESEKQSLAPLFDQVKNYLEATELFKNKNLRLSELAVALQISEKQISQAVNECTGDNFNAFINHYRISLAEKLLLDAGYNHYTIDAIAEESGFSNKVSFYKAFKKIHNQSPKEYKEAKNS